MSSLSFLLLLACLLPISWASPIQLDRLEARQQTGDCSDLSQSLVASCWEPMNVTQNVLQWWKEKGTATDGTLCQQQNLTFATCFLANHSTEAHPLTNLQCNTTGSGNCPIPITNLTPWQDEPWVGYVLFSIFAQAQWFNSIFNALDISRNNAFDSIGKIVLLFNPTKSANPPFLSTFLSALSAGVAFLAFPAERLGPLAAQGLTAALQQSPGAAKALLPVGTAASQNLQVADIEASLGNLTQTYQNNIAEGLAAVLNDVNYFLNFAANGNFIGAVSDLDAQTNNLTANLQNYVISQCLAANNIDISVAYDTDPAQLQANSSATLNKNVPISCASYDANNICNTWWHDPNNNAAWSFFNKGEPAKSYYTEMETVIANGWTTGVELFLGAQTCADLGGGSATINPTTFQPVCMVNNAVCVWDPSGNLEFTNCETQTDDWLAACNQVSASQARGKKIPTAYLGPWLTKTGVSSYMCH
ncbi:MAG: hypothetical protein M1812_003032 [Candelaria pacifica]|nr:MAG: hypothetical protein M1812_003032 [Candelaria pacifica]